MVWLALICMHSYEAHDILNHAILHHHRWEAEHVGDTYTGIMLGDMSTSLS